MEFDFSKQPGLKKWDRGLKCDGEPLVTVITPYYNGGQYIEQTYNCVINQTFPWFEWIIVDDGSTEKADLELLEKLAATDPRIRVAHKENGGISTARNLGLRLAKTEYFVPLDCDDLIEPTFLEYCWWMLEKNPGAAWSYADSVGFQDIEYIWEKEFDPIVLKTENHLTATSLFRKDIVTEMGGYAEIAKHYNEDWYLYLRMLGKGYYPVQARHEFLFWYRRRDGGVLSIVGKQSKETDLNEELISSAAKDVISPHRPIIYPVEKANFDKPKKSDWNRCVFTKHDKIHVTILTSWLEMGGADKFNLDLLKGLDKEKFEVSILTTIPSKEPWEQRFRDVTPDVFNLPNFVNPKDYAEFVSYFIQSRQTDVLLVTNSYHGYYLMPWLRRLYPQLAIIDYVHMEEWYWRNGGYARTSATMAKITEKTYVCNSATRDVMIREFQRLPDSVETIHIGIDSDYCCADRVRQGMVYEALGIDKCRPIVLFICRLHPQKRPFMMLKIAEKLKNKVPDVAFVVVGSGEQYKELRDRTLRSGLEDTVYFVGGKKEVRPFYRDAKVTLICSLMEGLSLTAYESCSMGVPVVSADVGGQKDLVDDKVGKLIQCRQDRAKGLHKKIFNQQEVDEYVDALAYILTNPQVHQQMTETCRDRVLKGFSLKNMVNHFTEIFTDLVNDKAKVEARRASSESLAAFGALSEELFTMEMQQQMEEYGHGGYLLRESEIYDELAASGSSDATVQKLNGKIDKQIAERDIALNRHEEVVNRHEEVVNRHEEVVNRHEEVVNRHEEVINRHEEVINRHEEVINRHEQAINDDWAWLKNLESRVTALEQKKSGGLSFMK